MMTDTTLEQIQPCTEMPNNPNFQVVSTDENNGYPFQELIINEPITVSVADVQHTVLDTTEAVAVTQSSIDELKVKTFKVQSRFEELSALGFIGGLLATLAFDKDWKTGIERAKAFAPMLGGLVIPQIIGHLVNRNRKRQINQLQVALNANNVVSKDNKVAAYTDDHTVGSDMNVVAHNNDVSSDLLIKDLPNITVGFRKDDRLANIRQKREQLHAAIESHVEQGVEVHFDYMIRSVRKILQEEYELAGVDVDERLAMYDLAMERKKMKLLENRERIEMQKLDVASGSTNFEELKKCFAYPAQDMPDGKNLVYGTKKV